MGRATRLACCAGFVVGIISISLFASAFQTLEPNEYGIEANFNTRKLNEDSIYRGGRRFVGVGHEFIRFPANRMILAFSNWANIGRAGAGCWYDDTDADEDSGCLYGESTDQDKIAAEHTLKNAPLDARTSDGLRIQVQVAIIFSIGRNSAPNWDDAEFASAADAGEPPQPDEQLKASLVRLYRLGGREKWRHLAVQAAANSIRKAVGEVIASDLYTARKAFTKQTLFNYLANSFDYIELTFHNVFLLNVAFPEDFERAIQRTEIAYQQLEQARYVQVARVTEAETQVVRATVEAATLNYTANVTAETSYVTRAKEADIIQVQIEQKAQALAEVSSSLGLDANETLTFAWLMAMQLGAPNAVTLDTPIPNSVILP